MKIGYTALWALTLFVLTNISAHGNEFLERAWSEINKKNFSGAQAILSDRLQSHPTEVQTQFLYARTLAWGGKYPEAIATMDQILEQQPKNSDYLFTKARILSWQNKNLQAIRLLDQARAISPNYFDIWQLQFSLLKREYAEKNGDKINSYFVQFKNQFPNKKIQPLIVPAPAKKRYILATANYEIFNNNYKNGKGTSISYGDSWKKYQFVLGLDFINRFNLNDQQFNLSASTKKKTNIWLSGGISASSQHSLLPTYSIYAQVNYLTHKKWLGSYKLSHKGYKSVTVNNNQLAISKRWKNFEPRFALYITTIDYIDITLGASAQLTHFFENNHTIRLSISAGNELEYIGKKTKIYNVQNITIDGKYQISPVWHFIYAISHHIQGTAYTQNGILSGLQFRF